MVHWRLVHQEQGCSQGNSNLMIARVATRKYGRQDGLSTSSAVGVYMLPCLSSAWWEMDPRNAFAIFWGSFGIASTVYLAAPILCLWPMSELFILCIAPHSLEKRHRWIFSSPRVKSIVWRESAECNEVYTGCSRLSWLWQILSVRLPIHWRRICMEEYEFMSIDEITGESVV